MKNISTVEALRECLNAYYFQEGRRAKKPIIDKMHQLIKSMEASQQPPKKTIKGEGK